MFGYVTANRKELSKEQLLRYNAVYCGICRQIRSSASQSARLALSYDMAFLALLLMSLYEPEETIGDRACMLHPFQKRSWVDNRFIRYAADMNVALGYYNAQDDAEDDNSFSAKIMTSVFGKHLSDIQDRYPRQCEAMEACIRKLKTLEEENCPNPDAPASCFGSLMAELLVFEEDLWSPTLRQMGMASGRFIYLMYAAADYRRDDKKGKYNPFLAMGTGNSPQLWEQYLVLEMAQCSEMFEKLPLVQDKPLLDCILYSGVWLQFERLRPKENGAQEERT